MPTIYFDMDGTIANLYGVPNWLEKLQRDDPTPYRQAVPMVDMRVLARYLNHLKRNGYRLGIISWLSMNSTPNYKELVRKRKLDWLAKHLGSVDWDEIHLIAYGTPKQYVAFDSAGILFDDNEEVRGKWKGIAYTEQEILSILRKLVRMC